MIIVAALLFMLPALRLPYIDSNTDSYFRSTMAKAASAYGICRIVNASVSVVKESHLQIEPGGFGVSLAIGQVLDPLDDLAERASDVLVTSIASLGIQQISYEISVALAPPIIGGLLIILLILSQIKHRRARSVSSLMSRIIVVFVVARLCLPFSALVSGYLQDRFFNPQIAEAKAAISLSSPDPEILKTEFSSTVATMTKNMGQIVENLLKLSWLYAGIFFVQVILLPILMFWGLVKIVNSLFGLNVPYIIRHAELLPEAQRQMPGAGGSEGA